MKNVCRKLAEAVCKSSQGKKVLIVEVPIYLISTTIMRQKRWIPLLLSIWKKVMLTA